MRALVCVFDALRPDLVGPELTPNIHAFAKRGVRYTNSRSTYPTETRVNQSAVTTGCLPRRHGVVGNKFLARELLGDRLLDSGKDDQLAAALASGAVLGVPLMGQRLAAAGKRFASLSAGTPGGGRLINWSAEADGMTRLAMRAPEACVPADLYARCVDKTGPMPEYELPAGRWIDWAVAAYLDVYEAEISPDVMLLWLCEPDESFHWHGIGSPESFDAIRAVDAAFGRILDHHSGAIASGEMQVIAMSDHGQVSLAGGRVDLVAALGEAGFAASRTGLGDVDVAFAVANGGGLWLRDAGRTDELVSWLLDQTWCGPLFTKYGACGTLKQAEIMVDHPRAPDVSMIFRSDDEKNSFGVRGLSQHDAPYPEGGGCHGGLNGRELRNFLALGGSAFREGLDISAPAGNPDILPTLMSVLGLDVPGGIDGRLLSEAMAGGPAPEAVAWRQGTVRSTNTRGPVTALWFSEVGHHRYLDEARVLA